MQTIYTVESEGNGQLENDFIRKAEIWIQVTDYTLDTFP